jgi:hypothetical protein
MGKSSRALVKVKNQISQDKLAILYTPLNFCYAHLPRPSSPNTDSREMKGDNSYSAMENILAQNV